MGSLVITAAYDGRKQNKLKQNGKI